MGLDVLVFCHYSLCLVNLLRGEKAAIDREGVRTIVLPFLW